MARSMLISLVLAALIGCSGDHAEQYLQQGFNHFQQQEYDQAIKSYQKAIELEPKNAAAYNMIGMAYRFKYNQSANPEWRAQEIGAFRKSIEINPQYWVALVNLGATYYYQGEKAKAAPLFKQALVLNPGHPEKAHLEKMIAEGEGQK
jgi:tetratricopeptide (TPR) repeat protein